MSEWILAVVLAGLGADDFQKRELSSDLLRTTLWVSNWRAPLDAALASPDPEVQKRAREALDEYEAVPPPTGCEFPRIEFLDIPADSPPACLELLKMRKLEADLRELEWALWANHVIRRYLSAARQCDTERTVPELVRLGLSRRVLEGALQKAVEKDRTAPQYVPEDY